MRHPHVRSSQSASTSRCRLSARHSGPGQSDDDRARCGRVGHELPDTEPAAGRVRPHPRGAPAVHPGSRPRASQGRGPLHRWRSQRRWVTQASRRFPVGFGELERFPHIRRHGEAQPGLGRFLPRQFQRLRRSADAFAGVVARPTRNSHDERSWPSADEYRRPAPARAAGWTDAQADHGEALVGRARPAAQAHGQLHRKPGRRRR